MDQRPASWTELGAELACAREAAGRSIAWVAERTKIQRHHIEAIERGDLDRIAAPLYAVGFARAVSAAVGIAQGGIRDRVLRGYGDRGGQPVSS